MAELTGKAISELPELTTVNNAALVALSENGSSKKMTLATLVGNLLKKTGDTMTGNLMIRTNNPLAALKNTAMDATSASYASATSASGLQFFDANTVPVAQYADRYETDGSTGVSIAGNKVVNGRNVWNQLRLLVKPNGVREVLVTDAGAWRKALGLCYAVNGTFTNSFIVENGMVTSSSTQITFSVNVPLSMENISTVTVTSLNGFLRGINGYIDNISAQTNFATASGYSVTAVKQSNSEVRVTVAKSSAYTNVSNNTPTSYSGNITLKFT